MRRAEIEQMVADYREQELYKSHVRINGIAWWKRDEFAATDLAGVERRTETYARSLGEPDDEPQQEQEPEPEQQTEPQQQPEDPVPAPADVQPVAPAPTVQPGMKAA